MIKKFFICFGILITFLSYACQATGDFELVKTDNSEGVIVPAAQGREFYSGNLFTAQYWAPEKEDIFKIESKLKDYLEAQKPSQSPLLWRKTSDYYRQYVGITVKGRKNIWVNFFHKNHDPMEKWKKNPVFVYDGGDSFFNLVYDTETGLFSDLSINGEA